MSTKFFNLNLTATTKTLYDYLTNTCLSHGSYLNPVKVGPFIHGWTDNTYEGPHGEIPAIDESLPQIDDSYDAIRWRARETDWIDYDLRIGTPTLQYIEIINLNPFGENGSSTYDQPMTKSDWKQYFKPYDDDGFHVAPNGKLYITPDQDCDTSVSVKIKGNNPGIYAGFNVVFLLPVDGVNYCCIIDPIIKVRKKDE